MPNRAKLKFLIAVPFSYSFVALNPSYGLRTSHSIECTCHDVTTPDVKIPPETFLGVTSRSVPKRVSFKKNLPHRNFLTNRLKVDTGNWTAGNSASTTSLKSASLAHRPSKVLWRIHLGLTGHSLWLDLKFFSAGAGVDYKPCQAPPHRLASDRRGGELGVIESAAPR